MIAIDFQRRLTRDGFRVDSLDAQFDGGVAHRGPQGLAASYVYGWRGEIVLITCSGAPKMRASARLRDLLEDAGYSAGGASAWVRHVSNNRKREIRLIERILEDGVNASLPRRAPVVAPPINWRRRPTLRTWTSIAEETERSPLLSNFGFGMSKDVAGAMHLRWEVLASSSSEKTQFDVIASWPSTASEEAGSFEAKLRQRGFSVSYYSPERKSCQKTFECTDALEAAIAVMNQASAAK